MPSSLRNQKRALYTQEVKLKIGYEMSWMYWKQNMTSLQKHSEFLTTELSFQNSQVNVFIGRYDWQKIVSKNLLELLDRSRLEI